MLYADGITQPAITIFVANIMVSPHPSRSLIAPDPTFRVYTATVPKAAFARRQFVAEVFSNHSSL